jgi:hypothetical protein
MSISNSLFETLPLDWRCPGCNRQRGEVPRVNRQGDEIAKAVEHHDHIMDFPNAEMRSRFGRNWASTVPKGVPDYLNKIERFVVGFNPTVVCEDCNNAEAKAKQLVTAPTFFSFAPSEIHSFILRSPNTKHEVVPARVESVYASSTIRYTLRMDVATRLLTDALSGIFWTTIK